MAKGKVAMLVAKRKFEIQEYDIPEINDDQMLVKIEGVGVYTPSGRPTCWISA